MRLIAGLFGGCLVFGGLLLLVLAGVFAYDSWPMPNGQWGIPVSLTFLGFFAAGWGESIRLRASISRRWLAYERVRLGLTFDEVCSVLGYDGRLISSSTELVDGREVETRSVHWFTQDELGWAEVVFKNGRAISKSEFNFK